MTHYINPHGKVFDHLDRVLAWQRGDKPAPVTLEWDLSNRCPWGCQDCHFAYTHTKGPWTRDARVLPMAHDKGGDLADESLVRRVIGQAKAAGVHGVVWTGGGEPTTHPDHAGIFAHAYQAGLQQGMYTMGALLTEAASAWIRDYFSWVVVSLDAHTPEAYMHDKRSPITGFARACQAIQRMSGGACTVGVSFLLHGQNHMYAEDMVALARALGATYTTLRPTIRTAPDAPDTPIGDRTWVYQAMPALEYLSTQPDVEVSPSRFLQWATWQQHPYPTCYGIRLNATITPDGRMWVCPNRREYAGASCLGDLRTESFASIWAKHPGHITVDQDCRAMCRLHPVNETMAAIYAPRAHREFI
jgi:MoaA/NifB/PqqE/SkfB family radical SAM enzyme